MNTLNMNILNKDIIEYAVYGTFFILSIILLYMISIILLNFRQIKESKKLVELKEYEINLNANVDVNILDQLDILISSCFNEYMVLNIEYRELEYINKEIEDIIIRDVAHIVIDRLSPSFINKINLIFDRDCLSDIISKKVYLYTMNYILSKNKGKN